MIHIDYKENKSIYEQIRDRLKELIISGSLKKGEKLPSVRELSCELTVNPNTVQRAYRELENEGYLYSVAGKGNYVSDEVKEKTDTKELFKKLDGVIKELSFAGTEKEKVIDFINEIYSERSKKND